MNQLFDIVIIGSGPGGYRAATLGALRNKSVAIIEKHQWGGCCLNRGCVPKKAWFQTASLLNQLDALKKTGITGQLAPDFTQAWQHQQQTSQQVRDSYTSYMQRLGIQSFTGHGRLLSNTEVEICKHDSNIIISAKHIIIATGSEPVFPANVQPSSRLISTDELFEQRVPAGDEVALIGSGVVAVELAFILAKLGKNIHWYARSGILNNNTFSEQAKQVLIEAFKQAQISLPILESPINYQEDNQIELQFNNRASVSVDWVLFATGRKPHTANLGLENVAVTLNNQGFIETNQYLQCGEENIYAIGDVRSANMTANQAISDATVTIENICHANAAIAKDTEIPQAIYSAIEMAKLGLNEEQAEDNDFEPATGFAGFESSPSALGQNDTKGFLRIVADMDSGQFLGGEIIGKNAGELIHLMSLPYNTNAALQQFSQLLINHPSRSEEIVNATETLANKWNMGEFVFKKP